MKNLILAWFKMETNESDKCIYYTFFDNGYIIVSLYVDKLIFGSNMLAIREIKKNTL